MSQILNKSTLIRPLTPPRIDIIYGSPPFERTNVEQVLFNFCLHIFNDGNILVSLDVWYQIN